MSRGNCRYIRVGRGNSSNRGNTCGRGQKGQKSRSGYSSKGVLSINNGRKSIVKFLQLICIKYVYNRVVGIFKYFIYVCMFYYGTFFRDMYYKLYTKTFGNNKKYYCNLKYLGYYLGCYEYWY